LHATFVVEIDGRSRVRGAGLCGMSIGFCVALEEYGRLSGKRIVIGLKMA
jgi:hypothetical protein